MTKNLFQLIPERLPFRFPSIPAGLRCSGSPFPLIAVRVPEQSLLEDEWRSRFRRLIMHREISSRISDFSQRIAPQALGNRNGKRPYFLPPAREYNGYTHPAGRLGNHPYHLRRSLRGPRWFFGADPKPGAGPIRIRRTSPRWSRLFVQDSIDRNTLSRTFYVGATHPEAGQ
jgi:hypothetical protein